MSKNITSQIIIVVLSFMFIAESLSADTTTIIVQPLPNTSSQHKENAIKEGHRMPIQQNLCTISDTDGVSITTVDTEDIYLYEIYDNSSCCIATFSNDYDFVSYLFSLSGNYLIQFTTADNIYSGYIQL